VEFITLSPLTTAYLNVQGYQYNYTLNVFLSSGTVRFPSLTAVNTFTTNRVVSSFCPPFSGYNLPQKYFAAIDNNNLRVTIPGFALSGTGIVDVVFYNKAGYTKLSNRNQLISVVL
jgi:hypothetical protein